MLNYKRYNKIIDKILDEGKKPRLNEAPKKSTEVSKSEIARAENLVALVHTCVDPLVDLKNDLQKMEGIGFSKLIEDLKAITEVGANLKIYGKMMAQKKWGKGGPREFLDEFYSDAVKFFENDALTMTLNRAENMKDTLKTAASHVLDAAAAMTKMKQIKI